MDKDKKEEKYSNKVEDVGVWADQFFENQPYKKQILLCTAEAIEDNLFSKITIKDGDTTYTLDKDADNYIRIKRKTTQKEEETF